MMINVRSSKSNVSSAYQWKLFQLIQDYFIYEAKTVDWNVKRKAANDVLSMGLR